MNDYPAAVTAVSQVEPVPRRIRAFLAVTAWFDWAALDALFELDEQASVHPSNPYVRVDAPALDLPMRGELDGVVLAESPAPVMVLETGLPTRHYVNPTEINFGYLVPSLLSGCPSKGTTSRPWPVRVGDTVHPNLAWARSPPWPLHQHRSDLQRPGEPCERN